MQKDIKKNLENLKTPCFVVDEDRLKTNLEILKGVMDRTGCKILLAQKAFSTFCTYPVIGRYLAGTTASGLFEARLAREEMSGEVHCYMPAYPESQFDEVIEVCDHIVFNSFSQWKKYRGKIFEARKNGKHIECGIRINPEYAEVETDIYNPCFTGSRLGTTLANFEEDELEGIDGLHFHAMCEQNSDVLKRILAVAEEKFGKYFHQMKWINFGGGHHITRDNYDIETLCECIKHVQETYDVQVYLEPGEAVALNAGYLVTRVLDIMKNDISIAILDTSAACHMPDVLEMPYRPPLMTSGMPGEKKYTYRFGGPTCLAGDIIGDYSFDEELKEGDMLVFEDMAIYTMVKTNTFNGMPLPSIAVYSEEKGARVVKEFGYEDFKMRLS